MCSKLNLIALILVSVTNIVPVIAEDCRDVLYNADCKHNEVCDAKSFSCKKEKEGNSEHGMNSITFPI